MTTSRTHTSRRSPRGIVDHVGRGEVRQGYQPTLTPDNAPLGELSVGRIRLDRKGVARHAGGTGSNEVLLHILVGQCTIEASGRWGRQTFKQLGERVDVFSGLPTSLVLGPRTAYTITPVTRTIDIAVASLPVGRAGRGTPTVIRPQDVQVHTIGEGHYLRTVREVIGGEGPALRLRAGETINPTGHWSSWPHHDFDANAKLAPQFEEVFLYFTKPRSGWGLQRRDGLYSDLRRVDDVIVVKNGDAAILPLGAHPIVAGVDSQLLYIWFYMSPIPKRYSKWAEDLGGYA
jgi:5-deoxy-glucuronate isomerase